MRYGSVCSGIEAATVAWHPLGWDPRFFSEIEPFPSDILAQRHSATPNLGDMTAFKTWPDYAIDLLVGGTPCQSFSVAGLRKGLADPRGNLMLTYLAIAARYRPRWLVWENVPGVLSSNGGKDFGTLLGGLGQLGYGFAYRVLDAQYVRVESHARAVPQRRRRVFVVGYFGDWRRAAAVLFERESLRGDSAPRRETGKIVAPTISARTKGGGGLGTDFDCDGGLIEVAPALDTTLGKNGGCSIQDINHGCGHLIVAHCNGTDVQDGGGIANVLSAANAKCADTILAFSCKDHGADAAEGVAPTMRAMTHDGSHANAGGQLAIAFNGRQDPDVSGGFSGPIDTDAGTHAVLTLAIRGRGDSHDLEARADGTANAVLTPNGGRAGIGVGAIQRGMAVRRLTPLECERLQGFPDGYTAILRNGKPAADGPRYRALGNSMAVNCMAWIGQRIAKVEEIR